jgi:hypothetical protein
MITVPTVPWPRPGKYDQTKTDSQHEIQDKDAEKERDTLLDFSKIQ